MARLTQEQRLARYRDRISTSRQWREDQGYVDTWRRMIDLYRGKQVADEGDQAVVNLAFSIANIVTSSVTTQYPKFTVNPNIIGQDAKATIAEAVLNYSWQHYNFHDDFQAAVVDMCHVGHGWLKVGWRYKTHTESVTLDANEQMAQVMEGMADASAMAGSMPGQAGELPTDQQIAEGVEPTQRQEVVDEDDPFVERVSPFDVVVDPDACSVRELRWIAQRTIRDLDEVRDDPAYVATARHKVQADMSSGNPDDRYRDYSWQSAPQAAEDDERVTVWEFYDLQEKEWAVFAENGEGFLIKPAPIPHPYPNCFVMFRDYDVPDTFYPMGEIEAIESLQEELNKTRTQQVNARKQFIRKFIGREAALGDRAREALASEVDGDVAFITDDDRPLNDIIVQAPSLTFDPNLFNAHSGQIVQDVQMVTGLSDYQFGQMPDTRRLATEAMAVEGATNARSSFKLSKIERTLARVGRCLLAVMQEFMDTERVARVTGPGGEMLFQYTADDIEGEFDFSVEAGSTQPKNDMIRRQEAVTLFNTLAPYMGMLIDPKALVSYLLQQGYDIKNVERFFAPPPPPVPPGGQPGMAPPGMEQGAGPPGLMPPAGGPAPEAAPSNGQVPIPA